MRAFFSVIADSDLFGALASVCLLVAVAGLFSSVRRSKLYFPAVFACLMFMPMLHAIGSYFLSLPNP
ncbi:hypothetical protein BAN20980_04780 [Burkholderia anthina]|uniref:Uncharacterized protein n=1 Tax=Burkholderia anthina TaxID=179879 RepID=A0A6P2GFJ4_9BURK|nr:hypothetical protein DCN14_19155 [Burkholderia sp. IDO3]PCD61355.1 hypothetical protein CN645_13595 [Burkholderia sp. IDO3]VVU52056.1 hypothetical protein BAN20980_04780 [Burkholderia anthina]